MGSTPPIERDLWVDLKRGQSREITLDPRTIDGAEAAAATTDMTPPIAPPEPIEPARPAASSHGLELPLGSWISFGAAGAAGVVAATFGALTISAKSAYEDAPTRARADTFFVRRRTTNIALATAAVSAGPGG